MQKTIFSKSSVERKDEYKIITRIYEEDGKKQVEKCAEGQKAFAHVERMAEFAKQNPYLTEHVKLVPCEKVGAGRVVFPYIEGIRLDQKIDEEAKNKQWEEVFKDVLLLKDIIMNVQGVEDFESQAPFEQIFGKHEKLNGLSAAKRINMDMVAANVILSDADIYVIDYEWNFDFAIPLKYILYRSILLNGTLHVLPEEKRTRLMELIDISEEEQDVFYQMEVSFQHYITGISLTDLYQYMPTKNIIVSEGNFSKNTFACRAEAVENKYILDTGSYSISDTPVMELNVKDYADQEIEICPADNPSIIKILELSGVRNGNKEDISFESNAELVWNDDVFFLENPVMKVKTRNYEKIIFRYRVLRIADPSDNIISVYVHNIRMQCENDDLKKNWLYWFAKKVKNKLLKH